MKCEDASRMISRLADGELSPAETEALNRHLASCAACRRESEATRRLDAALRDLPPPPVPEGMAERLRQAMAERVANRHAHAASPIFPALALAAALFFAVVIVYLAAQLREARREALDFALKAARAGQPVVPAVTAVRKSIPIPTELAVMEQLQVFRASREYLNGKLRWMVTDGDDVEIGMSSCSPTLAASKDRETIVLNLRYVECAKAEGPRLISNPEFVFFSGDEVSVRLRGHSEAEPILRYRVRGERLIDGRIRAEIGFANDSLPPDEVTSAISAKVHLVPGKPVLLGAGGDESRRWELYAWGLSRPIGYRGAAKESSPL